MPSPVAHGSVALALWPLLRADSGPETASWRRWTLAGMLVVMTWGPDIDFVPALLMSDPGVLRHGGATHSFAVGFVAGAVFASIGRTIAPLPWMRLWIVGCLAWWSHVVLDFFTLGGGAMAFWPILEERLVSSVPLFVGAEHSQPWAIHLHVITFVTELPFVLVMWWIGMQLSGHAPWPKRAPAASYFVRRRADTDRF